MMQAQRWAAVAILLGIGGCASNEGESLGVLARAADDLRALVAPAPASPKEIAKLASRSVWGVVPAPPRRKADLRPSMIRGSAVAIADDTLVASCTVVGKRRRVGLVPHNKYRLASVSRLRLSPGLCALRPAEAPLTILAGLRRIDDVRVGEVVLALTNRTAVDLELASGTLTAVAGGARPRLTTTVALRDGVASAILLDRAGNLLGLGPVGDGRMVAVPLAPTAAPRMALREPALASIWPVSGNDDAPLLLRAALDRDDDPLGSLPSVVAVSRAADDEDVPSRSAQDGEPSGPTASAPGEPAATAEAADAGPVSDRPRDLADRIGAALGLGDRGPDRDQGKARADNRDGRDRGGRRGGEGRGDHGGRGGEGRSGGGGDDGGGHGHGGGDHGGGGDD